jgi:hypothetical protein
LGLGSGPSASIRLLLWLCSYVLLTSSLQQPGVDLFCTQVVKGRINERPSRKHETVPDQNRVDGEVRGYIPKLWIALAAAALVAQRTVHDFMGQRAFEFPCLELVHEGWVIDNS